MEDDNVKELKKQIKQIRKEIKELNNFLQGYIMEAGFIEQEIEENKIEEGEEPEFLAKELNDITDVIDSLIEQRDNLEGQHAYLRGQLDVIESSKFNIKKKKLDKDITKLQASIFSILMTRPDREFKDMHPELFDNWEFTMYEQLKKLQLKLKQFQGWNKGIENMGTAKEEGEDR